MKSSTKLRFSWLAALATIVTSALADVGSDNPTGIAGQFGSDTIRTGCAYSAYTSNATRGITDLRVANSVGGYPLAFTRFLNTRYVAGLSTDFSAAGNWRRSFSWSIDTATTSGSSIKLPSSYAVNYPDGNRVICS